MKCKSKLTCDVNFTRKGCETEAAATMEVVYALYYDASDNICNTLEYTLTGGKNSLEQKNFPKKLWPIQMS